MPLALLEQEMADKSYRAALLVVRDCWEAIIKLCGIVLHADLARLVDASAEMSGNGINDNFASLTLGLLNKPPSMGDWVSFYC